MYGLPFSTPSIPLTMRMTTGRGFAISKVPSAAPPMMMQLRRLHQYEQLSVLHQVTAGHGSQHDNNTDNGEHS